MSYSLFLSFIVTIWTKNMFTINFNIRITVGVCVCICVYSQDRARTAATTNHRDLFVSARCVYFFLLYSCESLFSSHIMESERDYICCL